MKFIFAHCELCRATASGLLVKVVGEGGRDVGCWLVGGGGDDGDVPPAIIRNDLRREDQPLKVYEMKNYTAQHLRFPGLPFYDVHSRPHIQSLQLDRPQLPPLDSNIHNRGSGIFAVKWVDTETPSWLAAAAATSLVCSSNIVKALDVANH